MSGGSSRRYPPELRERRSNSRLPTTLNARDQPPAEVSDQRVSGLTGAVQIDLTSRSTAANDLPVTFKPGLKGGITEQISAFGSGSMRLFVA